jgi:N-acetylneuraminic acid mutarotase
MSKTVPFMLLFFFISGSFVAAFNPVLASGSVGDSWYTKASMSQARSGLGAVEVDGKIYAIGGYTNSGYVGTNERYDPMTNKWTILEPMPTPRSSFAIVAYDGKIYCIGGEIFEGDLGTIFAVNEVYDIATNSWNTKAALPFNGCAMGQVVNGKIFVMSYGNDLYMYDPVTDSWTAKASKHVYGYGNTLSMLDNMLVVGFEQSSMGFNGLPTVNIVMLYDPEIDTWSEKTRLDKIFNSVSAVAGVTTGIYAPQKVYFIGATSTTVYDSKSDTWSTAKAMPTERKNFAAVVFDDTLYVIGGEKASGNTFLNILYQLFQRGSLSVTEQYIPLNYSGTLSATPELFLSEIIIATILLTVSIFVIISLFFYLRARKSTRDVKHAQNF